MKTHPNNSDLTDLSLLLSVLASKKNYFLEI